MVVARAQPEADQSARIRHSLGLPAVVGLIASHGIFARLIPGSGSFTAQVVLADQGFLNSLRPLRVNFLLAARSRPAFTLPSRTCLLRLACGGRGRSGRLRAGFGRGGCARFRAAGCSICPIRSLVLGLSSVTTDDLRSGLSLLRDGRMWRRGSINQSQSTACGKPCAPHFSPGPSSQS